MSPNGSIIDRVFSDALDCAPGRRTAFLDVACDGDAELRNEVESLLSAHAGADSFLTTPLLGNRGTSTTQDLAHSMVGRRVDRYRIDGVIASGGMGTVFRAVRDDDHYQQRVAIKLIRLGTMTASMRRRFHQERQALAQLEHAYITRLIDGGATNDGVPYLVMELVDGLRIDAHCDQRRLSITDRLELFRKVCQAVHFAHQNLIVHRDLKPSNILVTPEGEPKLLDFGIAKLLDDPGDSGDVDATLTALRALTPRYASPEQVRGETITTATDVYSLGVILYELLTGRRPYSFDSGSDYQKGRVVCEQQPPTPSAAVVSPTGFVAGSEGSATLSSDTVGRLRGEQPAQLRRHLRGDLDNIVLMALQKEPQRRYASVQELSDDIGRYQDGLPVVARRSTVTYRTIKLVKRNKVVVAAAGIVLLTLVVGTIGTATGLIHARRAERFAQQERVAALRAEADAQDIRIFLQDMLAVSNPYRTGRNVTVAELLEEAEKRIQAELTDRPAVEAGVRYALANTYMGMWMWREAIPHLRVALKISERLYGPDDPRVADVLNLLGQSLAFKLDPSSVGIQKRALAIRREVYGSEHPLVAESYASVAFGRWQTEPPPPREPERMYREALAMYRRLGYGDHADVARFTFGRAMMLCELNELEEADRCFREALRIFRKRPDLQDRYTVECMNRYANFLIDGERYAEAEAILSESLALMPERGANIRFVSTKLLADIRGKFGSPEEALRLYGLALGAACRQVADEAPEDAAALEALADRLDATDARAFFEAFARLPHLWPLQANGWRRWMVDVSALLVDFGHHAEVLPLTAACLEQTQGDGVVDLSLFVRTMTIRGRSFTVTGDYPAAQRCLVTANRLASARFQRGGMIRRAAAEAIIKLYEAWGKPGKADPYRAMSTAGGDER